MFSACSRVAPRNDGAVSRLPTSSILQAADDAIERDALEDPRIALTPQALHGTSLQIWRCSNPCRAIRVDREEAGRMGMATDEDDRIVETPTEARQGEPGPSVLMLLAISTGLAVLILGGIWLVFFR
jgi:hypothetical protein